jgi:small nuclear ribonucleoprotein (snRNP)-like protein
MSKKAEAVTATSAKPLAEARQRAQDIPISLGKASLRQRLEAYYTLIAPETLTNRKEWLDRYDQIYEKYGGTHEGERKLASKLARKYGTAVQLLLAKSAETAHTMKKGTGTAQSEEWYQLRDEEKDSGNINALAANFDPVEALEAPLHQFLSANLWMCQSCTILDNVDKFATYLPVEDPLWRDQKTQRNTTSVATSATNTKKRPAAVHPFEAIAQNLDSGPMSLLHKLQRKRITIVIRYVNAIRGSLSGTLVAFDKHMNMILRDVEEVYCPRPLDNGNDVNNKRTNTELELDRRKSMIHPGKYDNTSSGWTVKRRQMKQLLVRGDMIVSIFEASKERKTSQSRYRRRDNTNMGKA